MGDTACSVGSRVVEVVINSHVSRAITLGKRRASVAFASSSKSVSTCDFAASREAGEERDDESDFESDEEDSDEDDEDGEIGLDENLERSLCPAGSETPRGKPYRCTHQDCLKSYTKPSRLAEHLRSHTGEVSASAIITFITPLNTII